MKKRAINFSFKEEKTACSVFVVNVIDYPKLFGVSMKTKKCGKKKFSDERAHLRGTGGPAKTTSSSEIQSDLQQILGNQMTGFNSEFDDDRNLTIPGSVMNSNSNSGMILDSNIGLKPINVVLDWSEYSPDYTY
ncbi:hypothetical protein QTP88_019515 [Uroleucon formosanum]